MLQPFHPAQVAGSFFGVKDERNLESKAIDLMIRQLAESNDEVRISDRERFAQQNLMSGMWVRLWERVILCLTCRQIAGQDK